MKSISIFVILICIMALVINVVNAGNELPSPKKLVNKEEKYIKCLNEKGLVFYGVSWCRHCKDQKKEFGKYLSKIKYIDCDKKARLCNTRGIQAYPTLILEREMNPNIEKNLNPGTIEELAKQAGCKI